MKNANGPVRPTGTEIQAIRFDEPEEADPLSTNSSPEPLCRHLQDGFGVTDGALRRGQLQDEITLGLGALEDIVNALELRQFESAAGSGGGAIRGRRFLKKKQRRIDHLLLGLEATVSELSVDDGADFWSEINSHVWLNSKGSRGPVAQVQKTVVQLCLPGPFFRKPDENLS